MVDEVDIVVFIYDFLIVGDYLVVDEFFFCCFGFVLIF